MREVEVYDYSSNGEPTLEWLVGKQECILIFSKEQVDFINEQKMLKSLFHDFCEKQQISVRVKNNNLKSEYEKYRQLQNEINNRKDMIDGCLNRIAVSDDEDEVERYYNDLINRSIKEYKEKARECHKQWLIYDEIFEEYCKGKKQND